jgi:hypothetical protein
MEDQNNNTSPDYSKTARKGFYTMLAGPALLLIWSGIYAICLAINTSWDTIVFLILIVIVGAVAFFLPLGGLIYAIKSLWHKDELDKTGFALAIITCVMCNPLFYFFYFFVCLSAALTGEINLSGGFSM